MVKINPKSKIWFLTRIGREIEWRIEKRKRICLQNLIPSRREREFFSKSWISRGEREFFLQNLDIREHLEKWKFNSPARDRKKWTISSRDFLEIENLVNACLETSRITWQWHNLLRTGTTKYHLIPLGNTRTTWPHFVPPITIWSQGHFRVIPAQSRGMPAKHDLPTKLRGISKKLHLETSLIWIWHEIFFLEAVTFFDTLHCGLFFVCFWNKGQLWQRLPIPLCHTYSESSGRALSHGTTQYMTYLLKKLTATRFRGPREQWFWGSELQIT